MQQLRERMGTNDKIPFCSFCLGSVPSGSSAQEAKRAATRDSQRIYELILEDAARIDFSPSIDALPDDLAGWVWDQAPDGSGLERPFRKARWEYRREVRKRGFWGLGEVAQLGADRAMSTPFLREANSSLLLVDVQGQRRDATEALSASLGAPIRVEAPTAAPFRIPAADSAFDGVVIQGRWLSLYGRDAVLAEARRVLRTGGRLQISAAPGLGATVDRALNAGPRGAAAAMKAIERGDDWGGRGGYLTERTLWDVLERAGFAIDSVRPPNVRRINGRYRERAPAVHASEDLLRRLRDPQSRAALASKESEFWSGMEATISISAFAAGARRPKSVGVPIAARRSAAAALAKDARSPAD
ncbi:MAG: methyltransferase domain-containing protein [Rhodoblastus sp.]